jgi:hypothetical protein
MLGEHEHSSHLHLKVYCAVFSYSCCRHPGGASVQAAGVQAAAEQHGAGGEAGGAILGGSAGDKGFARLQFRLHFLLTKVSFVRNQDTWC